MNWEPVLTGGTLRRGREPERYSRRDERRLARPKLARVPVQPSLRGAGFIVAHHRLAVHDRVMLPPCLRDSGGTSRHSNYFWQARYDDVNVFTSKKLVFRQNSPYTFANMSYGS
jgi:hypothetical protein